MSNIRAGAVILAAGYSSRMGEFKPLLDVGGMSAVERLCRAFAEAGVQDVVVVTGHSREFLFPVLKACGAREVYNPDFAEGMFTSVRAGVSAFSVGAGAAGSPGLVGIFLAPVDCPLISGQVIREMLSALSEAGADLPFAVACYYGKKGHPLFIPASHFGEILDYEGRRGLKGVTNRYEDSMLRVETKEEGVVLDMDTCEGYEEIRAYLREQAAGGGQGLLPAAASFQGRLFLVRHGETHQHAAKIFLGQTDVPLSERGREQALAAGELLKSCEPHAKRIYCSDLLRTAESAEIIRRVLSGNFTIEKRKEFREMHLGDWDGRFIHEIRAEEPEEYERRGKNLLRFKRGRRAENFFDLRYRVTKALNRILEDAGEEDVILVAHSGVIKVILCALMGAELSHQAEFSVERGSVILVDKENDDEGNSSRVSGWHRVGP